MKHFPTVVLLFFASSLLIFQLSAQVVRQPLDGSDWQFRQTGSRQWNPASVPGTVHTDLLAIGALKDPLYGDTEKWVQWVSNLSWEYQKIWTVTTDILERENLELVLKGLDTYAEVFVNGKLAGRTANMFQEYRFPVRALIRPGENQLRVVFRSPLLAALPDVEASPVHLPAGNDAMHVKTSPFTRKAAYHYGWDWGPRLVTSGIWRSVFLEASTGLRLGPVYMVTESASTQQAAIRGEIMLNRPPDPGTEIEVSFGQILKTLKPSGPKVSFRLEIRNPKLWVPGSPRPFLYPVCIRLRAKQITADSQKFDFGVRTLEVVHRPDSMGKSFYFRLNGVPVFMKGANYIPQDNFLPRVTRARYRKLLLQASAAGMNMLRVWGGGVYEDDAFYELCDSLGILVWQDFMFSCAMYPGTTSFFESVEEEVKQNIRRLRNHACLALWCGNNEIETGWKKRWIRSGVPYSEPDSARIYEDYKALFHRVIPDVVRAEDPARFYTSSSPSANDENIMPDRPGFGDTHDWFVWFGTGDYRAYSRTISRFQSEYGYQSFPAMESVSRFSGPSDWFEDSDVMDVHQKHAGGNEKIRRFMEPFYGRARDFGEFLYFSQLQQAEAMKFAIQAHRSRAPFCMGSLFWQLNDCWPAASWSSIDYYGRRKASYYFVRKAFEPVGIQLKPGRDSLHFSVFTDGARAGIPAVLEWQILEPGGGVLSESRTRIPSGPFRSAGPAAWSGSLRYPVSADSASALHRVRILDAGGKELAGDAAISVFPRNYRQLPVALGRKLEKEGSGWVLCLSSPVFVKNLMIASDSGDWHFSDNYFDMLPGREYRIALEGVGKPEPGMFRFRNLAGLVP